MHKTDYRRGFSSETFAFEAAQSYAADGRPVHVYHLGDFDRSGVAAAEDLRKKLTGFAAEAGVDVHFIRLAVTVEQIRQWSLPTREPKRNSAADRGWPYEIACEQPSAGAVETMAGLGLTATQIARVLKLDPEMVKTRYGEELEAGQVKANAKVAESLYRIATGHGREAVAAAILWLKARACWKEVSVREHLGQSVHVILTKEDTDL